jgi:hypothetical protein
MALLDYENCIPAPWNETKSVWNKTSSVWSIAYCDITTTFGTTKDDCGESFSSTIDSGTDSDWYSGITSYRPYTAYEPTNTTYEYLSVQYCMSEPFGGKCNVEVNNVLLGATCLSLLLKVALCALVLAKYSHQSPLTTIGDAIGSFITTPDPATRSMCTFNRWDFSKVKRNNKKGTRNNSWIGQPRRWEPLPKRLSAAVSRSTWILSYIYFVMVLIMAIVFLGLAIHSNGGL